MMGRNKNGQEKLFYQFCLEEAVPQGHLVRRIDHFLDLSWVHKELEPFYSHTGRPSIDPELMIRMLIIGYVFAIRSEREICREVQVNLAYRWFCRLGLEDNIPDHSAFSRARSDRFREGDVLRRVYERIVGSCIEAGLVGGEAFSIDASLIKADVNENRRISGADLAEGRVPEEASRTVRDYLTALDQELSTETDTYRRRRNPPKQVSLTDPKATWVARPRMRAFFAYDANYLIDNKLGIIVDAEGTCANRSDEIAITQTMIERVIRCFDLKPRRLAADTVYGNGKTLKWLMKRNITPHIPVWDKSARADGTYSRGDFTYDNRRNLYICPNGKALTTTGHIDQGRIIYYRAKRSDCRSCPLKPKCTTAEVRKLTRDRDEDVRDHVRAESTTEAFARSRRERKKVEMAFAHMKRILKLDRLRLRGLEGARDEVLLVAMAQNLRKLAKYAGSGLHPVPRMG
jgi:transposase